MNNLGQVQDVLRDFMSQKKIVVYFLNILDIKLESRPWSFSFLFLCENANKS